MLLTTCYLFYSRCFHTRNMLYLEMNHSFISLLILFSFAYFFFFSFFMDEAIFILSKHWLFLLLLPTFRFSRIIETMDNLQ
eukprot:m.25331 g.25331  ORF g.25331 m.25331 type:complete len:81 (+) comp5754_c0_seq1:1345-1587(+)